MPIRGRSAWRNPVRRMATEMSEQVMVRLTPDLLESLRAVSQDQERTVAQTIRLAVKQYLAGSLQPTA